MAYTHPDSLTLADSNILYADSHWNPLKENFKSLLTDPTTLAGVRVNSVLTAPGSSDLGHVYADVYDVSSEYRVRGTVGRMRVGDVYASRYAAQANSTTTFSTYIVASYTPVFSDSIIKVTAEIFGYARASAAAAESFRVNLNRAPNGTPIVLSTSNANALLMDAINAVDNGGTGVPQIGGQISITYQESNMSGGVALQYGIRIAATGVNGSHVAGNGARILIEEYR